MSKMKQSPLYGTTPSGPNPALTRYGSAPGSLLTSIADSVINEQQQQASANGSQSMFSNIGSGSEHQTLHMTRFFRDTNNVNSSDSSCAAKDQHHHTVGPTGVQRSNSYQHQHHQLHQHHHVVGEVSGGADESNNGDEQKAAAGGGGVNGGAHHLMRHSSSPAGFFSHLMVDNGFSVTRGMGHYPQPASNGVHTMPHTRPKSQLSFSRQEPLSQISEISVHEMGESVIGGNSSDETGGNAGQSYISSNYSIGSWDDSNSIAFSAPPSKRAKDCSEDLLTSLSHLDSQFSLPTTSLEMAAVEKILQAQQDSVAFKVRAKRGCATHPRSIAERERRTRISEKLRKLQDLVPNMDKQTSTADMLDLAVQHIKELQRQVQDLNQERSNCTCTCKEELP